jgi:hypothetical protein
MTSELQQSCEYASVENAQVTNTFFPESDNKNVATVKFTATVKVKIDGKLADDLRKYRTASALYSEYGNEMIELNRSHKEAMDAIEKARKAAQDKYMAQLNTQGFNAADRDKNDEAMRELYGQKDALSKESAAKANGIFDKYKDRAENLLYPNTTGSVRRYEPPNLKSPWPASATETPARRWEFSTSPCSKAKALLMTITPASRRPSKASGR